MLTAVEWPWQQVDGANSVTVYLQLREIELMKKLDHPNIIKIFEVFRGE